MQHLNTPLHSAACNGHAELCRLLLDCGAALEAREEDGATPLHLAAMNGHAEAVLLLLERGAQKEAREADGCTPLMYAAGNGHLEAARALLGAGASAAARGNDGRCALDVAASAPLRTLLRGPLDDGLLLPNSPPKLRVPTRLSASAAAPAAAGGFVHGTPPAASMMSRAPLALKPLQKSEAAAPAPRAPASPAKRLAATLAPWGPWAGAAPQPAASSSPATSAPKAGGVVFEALGSGRAQKSRGFFGNWEPAVQQHGFVAAPASSGGSPASEEQRASPLASQLQRVSLGRRSPGQVQGGVGFGPWASAAPQPRAAPKSGLRLGEEVVIVEPRVESEEEVDTPSSVAEDFFAPTPGGRISPALVVDGLSPP